MSRVGGAVNCVKAAQSGNPDAGMSVRPDFR
jgi:hypothetical protein